MDNRSEVGVRKWHIKVTVTVSILILMDNRSEEWGQRITNTELTRVSILILMDNRSEATIALA